MLVSIIGGELRQGALDGVIAAAVAKAAGVAVAEVQRAAMFAGSLPVAARVALTDGTAGLARDRAVTRSSGPTDVGVDRDRRRRRAGDDRHGVGRMEARRRAGPGAPGRRRGATVHPQPQRRDRPLGWRRRGRAGASGRRPRARRRGARCRRRRSAAAVPGHDGRLRGRRRMVPSRGSRLQPFFFDVLHAGSVDRRRTALGATGGAGGDSSRRPTGSRRSSPSMRSRRRHSSTVRSRPATRA